MPVMRDSKSQRPKNRIKPRSRSARAGDNSVEDTLRRGAELFQLIAENAADLIAVVDADGKRLYNNPAYTRVLGYAPEELREHWAFAEIHPDDRPRVLQVAQETFRTGVGQAVEYRMHRKDGSWRMFQSSGGVIRNSQGAVESLVVVAHDITEQTRSAEQLKRHAENFAALYETTRALANQYHLPTLLQTIVERACALLRVAGGAIYLCDSAGATLDVQAQKGTLNPKGARLRVGEGTTGGVVQSRQPLMVCNYSASEHRSPQYEGMEIAIVLEVPMLSGGDVIGVLSLFERAPTDRCFDDEDAKLLSLFAVQAASAVHNARLFEQVRAGRERQQVLAMRLMEAQEAERRHIARELHDEIGQAMTGVQLGLQAIEPYLTDPDASAHLVDSMKAIEQMLQQVRDLSLNLRPSILDDFGLVPALRRYLDQQARRTGLIVEFATETVQRLPPQIETVCYRIAQEALTNVARHARATRVSVSITESNGEARLFIRDDGVGFDVAETLKYAEGASLGLIGMRERAALVGGIVEIKSVIGEGTLIQAHFPVSPQRHFVERRARKRNSP